MIFTLEREKLGTDLIAGAGLGLETSGVKPCQPREYNEKF